MRCLILDNDEAPRDLLCRVVEHMGHRALAVATVDQALVSVLEADFDIAIVDMDLDDGCGSRAIAAIREHRPEMRILVVSGHGDPTRVLAAITAGADGYLLKDEAFESLPQALQEVRAGHTPLSSRVASIVVRKLRNGPRPVARLRSPG